MQDRLGFIDRLEWAPPDLLCRLHQHKRILLWVRRPDVN